MLTGPPPKFHGTRDILGKPCSRWSPFNGPGSGPGPMLVDVLGDELHVAESCPPELRRLVKETLMPLLALRGSERVAIRPNWSNSDRARFTPLVVTSKDDVLAAIYTTPHIAEVWWLPIEDADEECFDFAAWVSSAMDAWHLADPDHFPGPPDWARSKAWMTADELRLSAAVDEAQIELDETVAKLQAAVDDRAAALAKAQVAHDGAERRLLTAQGDDLVAAVRLMLEHVGFIVEDRDSTKEGQKLEDLRVFDPESTWVALAEVKGHLNSGGRPGEIAKLSRFVGLYEGQTGSLPDASWYVVNQFASRPPDRRRLLMDSHPEDVDEFAQALNGVVLDTRDLFLLDRQVAAGDLTAKETRALLMAANGRFQIGTPKNFGGLDEDGSTDS